MADQEASHRKHEGAHPPTSFLSGDDGDAVHASDFEKQGNAVRLVVRARIELPRVACRGRPVQPAVYHDAVSVQEPYAPRGRIGEPHRHLVGALRIEGSIDFPPVCCDIPYFFGHRNVAATAVPFLAIRVSEVELCWSSDSNRTYQVQNRSGSGLRRFHRPIPHLPRTNHRREAGRGPPGRAPAAACP